MTRAAIYARVSSAAQRDNHTIENQLRTLPAYVAAQGWTLTGTYVDDGRSAKTGQLERRDGFASLLRAAESRAFDVLVVVEVDRLTRTDSLEERAQILGPFQRLGIDIVTPSGGRLDMRTMLGELWVTLKALVAAEENRVRVDRINGGKARAIAEGRKPAGPTPFGYRYVRATGTWSIDELAAAIVREIYRRVAEGESCLQIAAELATRDSIPRPRTGWSRASVYRVVRNRTAVGEYDVDKKRGAVIRLPPIVTEQAWQDAQRALLSFRRRGLRRTKHTYLLEGLAKCGSCGEPIAIRSANSHPKRPNTAPIPAAYICRARKLKQTCKSPIVRCSEIDERVWSALCGQLAQPAVLAEIDRVGEDRAADARDWEADIAGYRAHVVRLETVQADLVRQYRRGQIFQGVYERELAEITREAGALRRQIDVANDALESTRAARARAMAPALAAFRAGLPLATPEERKSLLREMAADGEVVIDFGQVRLDLALLLPAEESDNEAPSLSLVDSRSYRKQHGAIVRFRLVA